MGFPQGFVWGAAAASYQVEGAAYEDGKGLSVWDMMCRQPGRIRQGDTGEVACDHYHRYKKDVALMAEIGLKAYRLSLSWPRILPDGVGQVNPRGLDFYDRLVDELLVHGIDPWVTLFHWDFPYQLYLRGGWLNRDSADWFADYAGVVVDKLGDRVSHWMTQNEPQCYLVLGLQKGIHAPGDRLGTAEVLLANHHSLLAHGMAVQAIRARSPQPAMIGAAPVGVTSYPATDDPADIEAARRHMFRVDPDDLFTNTMFTDPMLLGRYPGTAWEIFGSDMPDCRDGDLETMHQPLDFYGVNIYQGTPVRAECDPEPPPVGQQLTMMDWPVTPEALYWGPRFFHERYQLPVVVTENGLANTDWVAMDGQVHDPQRIDFVNRYLNAYRRAIDDGVPAIGYFLWSIMDNFEWALGYTRRFGIVHVDYETQKRTPKDSAWWYKEVIASNGTSLDD